jgi:hypothetical protein
MPRISDQPKVRLGLALGAGALIATVDNVLFRGEVSPIVIIGLLLAATSAAGFRWGKAGWMPAIAVWAWVPGVHLVKRILGWPDTLHPNTARSILALAAFTLGVAVVGMGGGLLARRITGRPAKP